MAAPAYRSRSEFVGDGSAHLTTTPTLAKPAGVVDGDLLIVVLNIGYGASTLAMSAAPAGWSLWYASGPVTSNSPSTGNFWVYAKIAAGEPASWAWTLNQQVAFYNCQAFAFTGENAAASAEQISAAGGTFASGSTIARSATTSGTDRLLVTIGMAANSTDPEPSWTENVGTEVVDTIGAGVASGCAVMLNTLTMSAQGTQTVNSTVVGGSNLAAVVFQAALMPNVVPVGKSVAFPYSKIAATGRSAAFPYLVAVPLGASAALPYNMGGPRGVSLALPYVAIAQLGKSVALPSSVRAFVGASRALLYSKRVLAGASLSLRWAVALVSPMGGRDTTDTYSDGTSNPFGPTNILMFDMTLFATFVTDWSAVVNEDDTYYARLPFEEAQGIFGAGAQDSSMPVRVAALGWHGTSVDDETGSFVLVNQDSDLLDLVGKRVLITRHDRAREEGVYAYCHDKIDLFEDLSVPRRLYMAIGLASEEEIPVVVEVIKPG